MAAAANPFTLENVIIAILSIFVIYLVIQGLRYEAKPIKYDGNEGHSRPIKEYEQK